MARRYSQIAADIWKNEDFRKLSAGAQRLYMILFSQADISPAGVLPMTVKRWASYAPDTTEDDIRAAIDELSDALFVVPDHETEELLVRSFVRWDGGHKNPKRLIAIGMAYRSVTSYPIDRALTREFTRLGVSFDGLSDSLSDDVSDDVSDSHRVVVKESVTIDNPQPTTTKPQPESRPRKRGTRIPEDFVVTAEMVAWAKAKVPHVDGKWETEKFINHWQGESGPNATKIDWVAAWRKWMQNAADRQSPRHNSRPPQQTIDDTAWMVNR